MPRNRAHQDRDDKREEIIRAASVLFAERGFEGTTMSAIAASAKITKNTVYWYFDDKDALLVVVLSRLLRATGQDESAHDPGPLEARLVDVVEMFEAIRPLTTSLHMRVEASSAVREWHERFHAAGDRWLQETIQGHLAQRGLPELPESALTPTVRLWSIAIEGMVTQRLGLAERRELCALLVSQVEAQAAAARLSSAGA